jgi:hypothetical protein
VKLLRHAPPSYAACMVLRLKDKDFLKLRGARGKAIEVVGGRVWITEDGRQGDRFLAAGGCYRVSGDGLVLVEAENDETTVRVLP